MRQISIIVAIATFLCSCHNHTNEMIEYCTDDSVICCKVPSYLQLTKTEGHTLYFEGNKRIAKILIVPSADRETKDFYINNIVGDSRSEISLVEDNDSITAYEIQRGMISIPAYIISMHERNGYAVMLVTYGIDLDIHKTMGIYIQCKTRNKNEMSDYMGDYLNLSYPSTWNVDENPGTLSADTYISQSDHAFGVWLFRFEKENNITFEEAMTTLADNWRKNATVEMSYKQINGIEWCCHDIHLEMPDFEGRQISFYTIRGNYIYNVKFGNSLQEVEENANVIDSIMSSVKIK